MSYSETKKIMIHLLKQSVMSIQRSSSVNILRNNEGSHERNRGSTRPQLLRLSASSGRSALLQRLKIGKNLHGTIPPIGAMSFENFQARVLVRDSLHRNPICSTETGAATTTLITDRTPFSRASPDRTAGLLNATMEGSRIKERKQVELFFDAVEELSFKDWLKPELKLNRRSFRFICCLIICFSVWWVHVSNTMIISDLRSLIDPVWVDFVRETMVERVCSNVVPGDACVCPDKLHEKVADLVKEDEAFYGLENDPLGLNKTEAKGAMLIAFFAFFMTLVFLSGHSSEIEISTDIKTLLHQLELRKSYS